MYVFMYVHTLTDHRSRHAPPLHESIMQPRNAALMTLEAGSVGVPQHRLGGSGCDPLPPPPPISTDVYALAI